MIKLNFQSFVFICTVILSSFSHGADIKLTKQINRYRAEHEKRMTDQNLNFTFIPLKKPSVTLALFQLMMLSQVAYSLPALNETKANLFSPVTTGFVNISNTNSTSINEQPQQSLSAIQNNTITAIIADGSPIYDLDNRKARRNRQLRIKQQKQELINGVKKLLKEDSQPNLSPECRVFKKDAHDTFLKTADKIIDRHRIAKENGKQFGIFFGINYGLCGSYEQEKILYALAQSLNISIVYQQLDTKQINLFNLYYNDREFPESEPGFPGFYYARRQGLDVRDTEPTQERPWPFNSGRYLYTMINLSECGKVDCPGAEPKLVEDMKDFLRWFKCPNFSMDANNIIQVIETNDNEDFIAVVGVFNLGDIYNFFVSRNNVELIYITTDTSTNHELFTLLREHLPRIMKIKNMFEPEIELCLKSIDDFENNANFYLNQKEVIPSVTRKNGYRFSVGD